MLVSLSRDAEPVAKALDHLGIKTIRGSKANARKRDKNKGGSKAIASALRLLKANGTLCVTPDGPRGPALQVSPGAPILAQRSGACLVAYALRVSAHRRLRSWDRMILPLPFSRGAVVFGDPIEPAGLTQQGLQNALQTSLEAANRRAQSLVDADGAGAKDNLRDAA